LELHCRLGRNLAYTCINPAKKSFKTNWVFVILKGAHTANPTAYIVGTICHVLGLVVGIFVHGSASYRADHVAELAAWMTSTKTPVMTVSSILR